MSVYIHHIETLTPPYAYAQDYARDRMKSWLPGKRTGRVIQGIYNRSGIDTRYSVLPDFCQGSEPVLFREDDCGRIMEPSTEPRNQHYGKWAGALAVETARQALTRTPAFPAEEVTHLITVSCTGFCNPGPDLAIVQGVGLPDSVERYHIGFMGCYAAFPAMRMARQFCQARPDAVVLVVCVELCTLHLQLCDEPDSLLANALFADGAAAAIISSRRPADGRPVLAMHTLSSALAPEGAGDMAWSIGDRGFTIHLSSYVPSIIAENIGVVVDRMLDPSPWRRSDIHHWAIHPGGRAILDKIQRELDLDPRQIADSRSVLRAYGNMSSSTILFVLKRILERGDDPTARASIFAMAFGPGLTIESALLERIPAPGPRTAERRTLGASHASA